MAWFNSGNRIKDHFVDVTEMIAIGKGGQRPAKTVLLSRYACYLAIQNADPNKEIVAQGQTYFAVQTRRQELADGRIEEERRVLLRDEMRRHNVQLAESLEGVMDWSCGLYQSLRVLRRSPGTPPVGSGIDFIGRG